MDTLKIAFDTIIIGALALPWVALLFDLFLHKEGKDLGHVLQFVKENAGAAVLLFAVAYSMGAALSRLAGEFFNDDDLGIAMTEDAIRGQVYVNASEHWPVDPGLRLKKGPASPATDSFWFGTPVDHPEGAETVFHQARRVFELQESALLLLGDDNTSRLRHIYQQLLILRGAALNGIILSLLFLFGFCAKQRKWGRGLLGGLCVVLTALVARAITNHLSSLHPKGEWLIDPPLMEISLFVVILAGFGLVWKGAGPGHRRYGAGFLISVVLTFIAYCGWWWTEVIYDELVINLFTAQSQGLLKPGP
jgi:hypothetical protein